MAVLFHTTFVARLNFKVLVGSLPEYLGENPGSLAHIILPMIRQVMWPTLIIFTDTNRTMYWSLIIKTLQYCTIEDVKWETRIFQDACLYKICDFLFRSYNMFHVKW